MHIILKILLSANITMHTKSLSHSLMGHHQSPVIPWGLPWSQDAKGLDQMASTVKKGVQTLAHLSDTSLAAVLLEV